MTDAIHFDTEQLRVVRQRLRHERQARVGILRNPNRPPKPPTRRASLTGKWMNMRSSRRPSAPDTPVKKRYAEPGAAAPSGPVEQRCQIAPSVQSAICTAEDGRITSVDVDRLMAAVDDHKALRTRDSRAPRAPFAAEMRPDITPQRRQSDPGYRKDPSPSVLSAAAWLDDLNDNPEPQSMVVPRDVALRPRMARSPWQGLVRMVTSAVAGMLLAVAILLVLLGPPP